MATVRLRQALLPVRVRMRACPQTGAAPPAGSVQGGRRRGAAGAEGVRRGARVGGRGGGQPATRGRARAVVALRGGSGGAEAAGGAGGGSGGRRESRGWQAEEQPVELLYFC